MFDFLRQVNRDHGTGVWFVTHNPALAASSDKIIQIVDERMMDTPEPAG